MQKTVEYRRQQILEILRTGDRPSFRELGIRLGVALSVVDRDLHALQDQGHLLINGKARSIRLAGQVCERCGGSGVEPQPS